MKRFLVALMVVTILAVSGMGSVAMAADTANVTVSATVAGTCKFYGGGTIAFALDPSVGGNITGTVTQPVFGCTKGTAYTITDNDGIRTDHTMKHASLADLIAYSFTYTGSGTGTGHASAQRIDMNIASTVAEAQYLNASAGNYADTVVLTITP